MITRCLATSYIHSGPLITGPVRGSAKYVLLISKSYQVRSSLSLRSLQDSLQPSGFPLATVMACKYSHRTIGNY